MVPRCRIGVRADIVQRKERLLLALAQRADLSIDVNLELFFICDIKIRSDQGLLGNNSRTLRDNLGRNKSFALSGDISS
jgi:hypothetical protein